MTENMIKYLKFRVKGINIAEKAEKDIDNELSVIRIVRFVSIKDIKFL